MIFLAPLQRNRRLLLVCLLSLLLHALVIAWIDARLTQRPAVIGMPDLTLRLVPAARGVVDAPSMAADVPAALAPPLAPAQPVAPAPIAVADGGPVATPSAAPPAAGEGEVPAASGGSAAPVQMPGIYRVKPPPSGRIDYALVTRSSPDAPAQEAGSASMVWRSDGTRYTVELDGVLGTISSQGQVDDAGIAPQRALSGMGTGALTTVFDRGSGTIGAGPQAQPFPLVPGSQDAASVLLQLAGMGVGDAGQIKDVLEFWVGGAGGAGIERYQVLGPERIDTAAGPLDTVRLARLGEPGAPVLELWLAPQHAWLPVQLRVTDALGASRTQTLASIAIEASVTRQE
ncbi:hypothetical protein [Massilia sp. MP_M2]|uniref:DUF3108 domain-containing protein n=1 Tax=Massilia sp. MP_M2 TaxID=3071713 RepID=UPI00319E05C7